MAYISVFVVLPICFVLAAYLNARPVAPTLARMQAFPGFIFPAFPVVALHYVCCHYFFQVLMRGEMAGPPAPTRVASGTTPLPADDEEASKKAKRARIVLAWRAVATLSTRQEAMVYIKSRGFSIFRHSHDTSVARCTKHEECVAGNGAHLRIKPARDGLGNVRALPPMVAQHLAMRSFSFDAMYFVHRLARGLRRRFLWRVPASTQAMW